MYLSPHASPSTSPPTRWDASVWGLMAVLCGVLFLDGLDVSMVGMALPSIESDLGLTTSQLQWIVSGYVLGYGGFLLLGGRVGGPARPAAHAARSRLAVFTVAVRARRPRRRRHAARPHALPQGRRRRRSPPPPGLSIITTRFAEGPERNRALSIYTATGASGFSLGLVAGGLLTELGWRWTFLLPVPIALALLVVGPRVTYRATASPATAPVVRHPRRRDADGRRCCCSCAPIVEAPEQGWGSPETIGAFVADRRPAGRLRRDRATLAARRSCGSASCAPGRSCARTSG